MTDQFQQIEGMTVNERLAHYNLFEAFDAAVLSRPIKDRGDFAKSKIQRETSHRDGGSHLSQSDEIRLLSHDLATLS